MARQSSSKFIFRSCNFDHIASKSSATVDPTKSGISYFITNSSKITRNPTYPSCLLNSHFSSSPKIPGLFGKLDPHTELLPSRNFLGFRYFSFKNHEMGTKSSAKKMVFSHNPDLSVKNAFLRSKIEGFWNRNYLVVLGAGGFAVCIVLWKVLFGIANTFIGFSEGMAKYGFLALSASIVALTGLYLRSRFTINPDKIYRMAMRKLNTSASILEVMGAPLTGTDLRAYVMSGGGITLKNFSLGLRSKRLFLIFPIKGSEENGLVIVEVKKKKGQYDMKLLAVDIPMRNGPDQRLFLIGDEEEYKTGGGLISELRKPVVKALAAAKEFEARELKEDEEDAKQEEIEIEEFVEGNPQ
ncbi:hypothetical protein ACJIZ3_022421 [Penstemon smallii]|uniref:Uncharacterized protein n=1 Tax=Penstemon smallii TaxID=265156 RepID=A0ABD3TLD2_9LAMI